VAEVHHPYHGVHVGKGLVDLLVHELPQGVHGLMEARGVHEDDLPVSLGEDAPKAFPGGLGAGAYGGHLDAQQVVEEGGLAHVGLAHDGTKPEISLLFHDG
jgi:hypothetical protein